jgi:hypothetical protein
VPGVRHYGRDPCPVNDNVSTDPGRGATNRLAWLLPDEPDVHNSGYKTPTQVTNTCNAYRSAQPSQQRWLSLSGSPLVGSGPGVAVDQKYAACATWVSTDYYPFDRRLSTDPATQIGQIGQEMDNLRRVAPTKNRLAFIETGKIARNNTPVTPAQMKAEIWEAIAHGARGIIYFPCTVWTNPIKRNNTTTGIAPMIKAQNALITRYASVLQGVVNPTGISLSAPAPFDTGWRKDSAGHKYFILINKSGVARAVKMRFAGVGGNRTASAIGESRTTRIDGAGYATDSLPAFGVRIYYLS